MISTSNSGDIGEGDGKEPDAGKLQPKIPHFSRSVSLNIKGIPSSILQNRGVSVLECITSFLKIEYNLTYHEIALLVGRDDRTIWTVYHRAQQKKPLPSKIKRPTFSIPFAVLQNRNLSILESIVVYLKDQLGKRYSEIALLVGRDDRTIWTVHKRASKKLNTLGVDHE